MPRRLPRRILLNTITSLSLLLLATTIALWIRSHAATDVLVYLRPDSAYHVQTTPDELAVGRDLADWSQQPADHYGLRYHHQPPDSTGDIALRFLTLSIGPADTTLFWHRAGFALWHFHSPAGRTTFSVVVLPFWSLALLFALLPTTRLLLRLHARRRERRPPTLCPTCRYDCRATPTRCPECGTLLP